VTLEIVMNLAQGVALASIVAAAIAIGALASAHDMSGMDMPAADPMHGDNPNGMSGAMSEMDAHMRMTTLVPPQPGDIDRAEYVLETCHRALIPFRNYHVALAEGFRIFLPQIPQPVYHFTDYRASGEEYRGNLDLNHPGSVLYVKDGEDYDLVGAMYSAPPDFATSQLNEFIPLSVARWHQHVNICLPEGITVNDLLRGEVGAGRTGMAGMIPVGAVPDAEQINMRAGVLADGRFGFEGKIKDRAACEAAGGDFIPLAFGWMVHVYPLNGDDLKVAFGLSVPKPPSN
jgi:hypothetical protein